MTTIERAAAFEIDSWTAAALVIGRAAAGLVLHGLTHPLRPATIARASGRVVAR